MTRSLSMQRGLTVLLTCFALLLAACGKGGGDSGTAQLRVLNISSDVPSVDVSLAGTKNFSAATTDTLTNYQSVTAQAYTVSVTNAGDPTSLFSGTFSFSKDQHYTGVVWGSGGGLRFNPLPEDENDGIASGNTAVRIFNATTAAGAFDVYLTPATQNVPDLSAIAPTRANVLGAGSANSNGLTGYAIVATGTYRLRITAAGNPNDVRLDIPSLTLGDVQYATVVITAGQGNALVNSTILIQQGKTLIPFNNAQARVRVVASVALNSDSTRSSVGVALDGAALPSGTLRSPAVGAYTPITAGSHQVDVNLNGVVVSSTTQAFAAGSDYTLMAWGAQASPQFAVFTDDNSVPAVGQVSLRLVNGDDTAGAVTLLVDSGNVLIPDVLPGAASLYSPAGATSSTLASSLEIDSQAASTFGPLFQNNNQILLSQGVYTVFLLRGGISQTTGLPAPTGLVRKDR